MSIISGNLPVAGVTNTAKLSNTEEQPNQQENEGQSVITDAPRSDSVELSITEIITNPDKTETNPKQVDDKESAREMSELNVAGENTKPTSYADNGSGESVEGNSVIGSQLDMKA
jgi:hypothetical protein